MKRLFAFAAVLALILSALAGCNGAQKDESLENRKQRSLRIAFEPHGLVY